MTTREPVSRLEAFKTEHLVDHPWMPGKCWAIRYEPGYRSLIKQYAPCQKASRKGHLTCWWHRNREDAATRLKDLLNSLKQATDSTEQGE